MAPIIASTSGRRPNDRVANRDRYLLSSKHSQSLEKFVPGLAGYWSLDKVSDDTYFSDLADRIAITSQTTLPREGGLAYTRGAWQFLARAQAFQTLQDPNGPPVGTPYSRMPQFLADGLHHGTQAANTLIKQTTSHGIG
jgi:LPS-assembly protein